MEQLPTSENPAEDMYTRAFLARMAIALLRERKAHGDAAIAQFVEEYAQSQIQRLQAEIETLKKKGVNDEDLQKLSEIAEEIGQLEMSPVVPGIENTTVLQRVLTSRLVKTINDSVIVPASSAESVRNSDVEVMLEKLSRFHLVFFDVNGLKAANDIGDHAAGDKVLQIFGLVAQSSASSVSRGENSFHVFHKSGDEFVVLCEDASEEDVDAFVKHVQSEYARYDLIQDVFGEENEKARLAVERILASANYTDKTMPKVPLSASAGTANIAQMMQKAAERLAQEHGTDILEAVRAQGSDLLPKMREKEALQDIINNLAARLISIADVEMQSTKEAEKRAAAKRDPGAAAILTFGRGTE